MERKMRYINVVGELVIPLIGVIFLNWGLYFILLFYFIDLLAEEVISYLKVRKIIQFQGIQFRFSQCYGRLILNSVFALLAIVVAHIGVYFIVPHIDFIDELIAFWNYEDGIPIPQGYILFPLVFFSSFQLYKTLFVRTQKYRTTSWSKVIENRRRMLFLTILGGVLAVIIANLFSIPEIYYLIAVVIGKLGVDIWTPQIHLKLIS